MCTLYWNYMLGVITHRIHVWYIYLHEVLILMLNVGKYTIHGSCGFYHAIKREITQNHLTFNLHCLIPRTLVLLKLRHHAWKWMVGGWNFRLGWPMFKGELLVLGSLLANLMQDPLRMQVGSLGWDPWWPKIWSNDYSDLTQPGTLKSKGSVLKGKWAPLFQGNLGWWSGWQRLSNWISQQSNLVTATLVDKLCW